MRWCVLVVLAACALERVEDGADDAFLVGGKADGAGLDAEEAAAVLALVNRATVAELDGDAGLDARAARNIVAHRDGPDARPGTADDDRFDDLAELDAVPYVGPAAFGLLVAHAAATGGEACLVISEYLEGQGNYNKGVELWNCGARELDLARHGICLVRDAATTCSVSAPLAGGLAPGAVATICRRKSGAYLDPMPLLAERCQLELPGVMTFSGNDRLVVFEDRDGSGGFSAGDPVDDAFGQIARAPSFELWADLVLRRCEPRRFDGASFFPYRAYFTQHARHDHSDYGVAPVARSCPPQ
jgi:hypothetical protein